MKIVKLNVVKSNLKDTVSKDVPILYGKYFNEALKAGEWNQAQVKANLDRFFAGQWGNVSSRTKDINNKHVEAGKGNLTGIYPRDKKRINDMIIFYSEYNDCIYVLSAYDFESNEEAWLSGDEEYFNEFKQTTKRKNPKYDPDDKSLFAEEEYIEIDEYKNGNTEFGEHGHQLKPEQKEFLRQMYPNATISKLPDDVKREYNNLKAAAKRRDLTSAELKRIKEIDELIEKIAFENDNADVASEGIHYPSTMASHGTVHQSEIDATRKAIESGLNSRGKKIDGIPENAEQILRAIAEKHNVDYIDLIEKITEQTIVKRKNLAQSYDFVIKNADKPFFFADSKKPEWLDDDLIEDIVYSKEWPTTVEIVAEALLKYGIKEKEDAIKYVKEYLNDNPHEKKHFKKIKTSHDSVSVNLKALEKSLFDIMVNYAKENGYEDADDYIVVDVMQKDDYVKVEIRNDLFSYYEVDDLIAKLDRAIAKYDAYFEPWDSNVWQAYIYDVKIKDSLKKDYLQERIINKDEEEYKNFELAAKLMTQQSPKKYHYHVGNTYLDYGQDWMWTTIITDDGGYQALNPREWKELFMAGSEEEIQKIVDGYFSDKFNPDRKRSEE